MFVSPTVPIPCHGSANKLPFGNDQYHAAAAAAAAAAALYGCQSQDQEYFDTGEIHHWSGMLPYDLPLSTNKQQAHGLCHPRWRAIMGEDGWYQSISDFEEENYFNCPHLQHQRHGDTVGSQGEEAMEGVNPREFAEVKTASATHGSHLSMVPASDGVFKFEPFPWQDGEASMSKSMSAWPGQPDQGHLDSPMRARMDMRPQVFDNSFPIIGGMGEEMFDNIDINKDLNALIGAQLEFHGLPDLPYEFALYSQDSAQIDMMHNSYIGSGEMGHLSPASPLTPLTSQEEDVSSMAYSPNMHANAYSHAMAESSYRPPMLHGSSPMRPDRQHQFLMKSARKGLPTSPMRVRKSSAPLAHYPLMRSTSFGEFSSSLSSVRSISPRDNASTIQLAMKELTTPSSITPASSSSPMYSVDERAAKDEFLVTARRAGMTYRDIKQQGGFAEAESTLRGRYRMLTKSREERVRNPKWTPVDVVLLRKAVLRHCNGRDPVLVKIPWKEIARFIFDNGGTYLFGNATCRKKWDELASFGIDQEVEDDDDIFVDEKLDICGNEGEDEEEDLDDDGEDEDEEMGEGQ